MCGIAGWLDWNRDIKRQETVLDAMSQTLERRGPDEGGSYRSRHAALMHRRLAVVDIENGKQPMYKRADGKEYCLVYNGELYNTEELRQELRLCGHSFSGHSDTEVLLLSYIQWGEACLEKLNGIFAFAVYEIQGEKLFLARDRAGVKPLFYHAYSDGLVFGSEIKTLLKNPMVTSKVDALGIGEIFLIGPGRTPGASAFRDVEELKPGECAVFDREGFRKKTYWKLQAAEHTDSPEETAEKVAALVADAITRQLVSDVPLCCFLSGGLDSSLISSIAAESYRSEGRKLTTYSVDYTDNSKYFKANFFQPNSDDYYIDIMCQDIASNHHKIILDHDDVGNALYDAALARDLPGMADVDSSLLLFCRAVKKNHTVAVSGECADEIFGGYPWYSDPEVLFRDDFPWSGNTEKKAELVRSGFLNFDPTEYVRSRYEDTIACAPKTGDESPLDARIKEVTMLNLKWFMNTLLDRKDRCSMYCGLEVRVPFCDHRIMEYTYNIPWEIKAWKGREKGLLRHAFRERLPREIVQRKKSPYPKSHHPAYVEHVKNKVRTMLDQTQAPIWEIVKPNAVRDLLETEAAVFTRPWYGQLMTFPQIMAYLYMVNTWLEAYHVDIC